MSQPNVLILNAHPGKGRLAHALAEAYADGARLGGAQAQVVALADLRFDPSLHDGFEGSQPLEPDLLAMKAAIESSRHLTIVTPLWWGADPALLKGFIDRVFLPRWAFRYKPNGFPEGLLAGRSARIIRTMDSPGVWYRFVLWRSADTALGRATLRFCGFGPVHHTRVTSVRTLKAPAFQRAIEGARRDGLSDARALVRGSRTTPSAP